METTVSAINVKPTKADRNKTKSPKKRYKCFESIQEIHDKKMLSFIQSEKSLPKKKEELKLTIKKKEMCKKRQDIPVLDLKIEELKKKIKSIEDKEEEVEYYSATCRILMEYENLLVREKTSIPNVSDKWDEPEIDNQKEKQRVLNAYYSAIGMQDRVVEFEQENLEWCKKCNVSKLEYETFLVCPVCGDSFFTVIQTSCTFKEKQERETVRQFDYKRLTHLTDQINQAQGKENTKIPQSILDTVTVQLHYERFDDMSKLTRDKVKEILKKTGNPKYYEHIPYIIGRLTGKYQNFPKELVDRITAMFMEIQVPFEKHRPPTRKNFLSYKYICSQFCKILEYNEYVDCFDLLKSREKLRAQDDIWKKICNDLGWPYHPTV